MMKRWMWNATALLALAACGGSAESRLKSSDKAAQEARDKDADAQKANEKSREAKKESEDESTKASKTVQKEREKYRDKVQDELKDTNAKLTPEPGKPAPSPQDSARLTQRRDTLTRDLSLTTSGGDKDWPMQKKQIEADLDAK